MAMQTGKTLHFLLTECSVPFGKYNLANMKRTLMKLQIQQ